MKEFTGQHMPMPRSPTEVDPFRDYQRFGVLYEREPGELDLTKWKATYFILRTPKTDTSGPVKTITAREFETLLYALSYEQGIPVSPELANCVRAFAAPTPPG